MQKNKYINRIMIMIFIIILIPFLSVLAIKEAIIPDTVYQGWQIGSLLCMILITCSVRKKSFKINWTTALFIMYHMVILGSTFLKQGFSSGILVVTAVSILIFILLQTSYFNTMLGSVSVIVTLTLIVNFWTLLREKGNENANFFIGGKNALSIFLIPGAFLLIINSLNQYGKIKRITMIIVVMCFVSVVIGASTTGVLTAIIAVIFMVLSKKNNVNKKVYVIAIFIVYVLFIIFSEYFLATQSWIKFTVLLGKDSTLTSRTIIWNLTKEIISKNWLFGAGRGESFSYVNAWGGTVTMHEAHNFILEILMEGGVVALTIYVILLYKIIRRLNIKNIRHKIIFIALCAILVNGLTESVVNNLFVTIILGVACRYANEKGVSS
ncbi:MAG: O-antigen ligase family protein [Tyzzerella sp.]|nr:O-antigen ligase family protein [Tyzzerella sp.]